MPRQSSVGRDTSAAFEPSGIVTLVTDFGLRDPFVGVMHGQVLVRYPAARIIDLTHGISPQAIDEAGFWLARSFRYFPLGTVHVAVVDPGVGTDRGVALLEAAGHVLLAPDNGLLGAVVQRTSGDTVRARRLAPQILESLGIHDLSATFHGRDLFAPLAGELASGRAAPAQLGPVASALVAGEEYAVNVTPEGIVGRVVTTDHFGNLLTNIEAEVLASCTRPRVRIGTLELTLQRTYGDVEPGEYVALVNSFGVLEVARSGGNAAVSLGIERGAQVRVHTTKPS